MDQLGYRPHNAVSPPDLEPCCAMLDHWLAKAPLHFHHIERGIEGQAGPRRRLRMSGEVILEEAQSHLLPLADMVVTVMGHKSLRARLPFVPGWLLGAELPGV